MLLKVVTLILLIPISGVTLSYLLFQPFTYKLEEKFFTLTLRNGLFLQNKNKIILRKKKRIVFLTDLHIHEFLPKNYIPNVIKKVNSLHPDLLLFGGDFVVDSFTEMGLLDQLKNFGSYKKITVLGNHDYDIRGSEYAVDDIGPKNDKFADRLGKKLERLGIRVLRNENYILNFQSGKKLNIFGIDSKWAKKSDPSKYSSQDFNIVLTHNPTCFTDLNLPDVSLVLSGHNHGGGQVRLNDRIGLHLIFVKFPVWKFSHFRRGFEHYVSGVYRNKFGLQMYSSKGVGVSGLGVRINCRPEIMVIDII